MNLIRTFATFPRDIASLPHSIRWIALVMFLYYLGWGIVEPFLGIYFNDLFGSYTSVGIIFSLLYFFSIFLSIPFGDLSDKVSKRTIIMLMLVFYIPIGPVIGILRTIGHAVMFRLYHAFLATGLWASTEAYVRSHSPRKQASESMGVFDMAVAGSSVLGALIGGFLIMRFGIHTLFYMMPLFSIAAFIAMIRLPDSDGVMSLRDGVREVFREGVFRHELRDFFAIPGIAYITALSIIFNVVGAGVAILLPLVYHSFGLSLWEIGVVYALFMMPVFFEGPFSVLADHVNKRALFIFGALAALSIEFVMVWTQSIIMLFVLSLCLGIVFALLRPLIEGVVTNCMPRERIGELNGVYRSFILLALALGSFIIGPIADAFTIQAPFLIGAVFMGIFFIIVLFVPRSLLKISE